MSWWSELELWQQLCIVLGCGIAVVMTAGFTKLLVRRSQMRKITKKTLAEKSDIEGSPAAESTLQLRQTEKDEIPFGIRALEAGIEVEGVVISRPTSPRVSVHNQSNLTLVGEGRASVASFKSLVASGSGNNSPNPSVTAFNQSSAQLQQPRSVHQPTPYLGSPFNYQASSSTLPHIASYHNSPAMTRNSSVENVPENSVPRFPPSVRGPSPTMHSYRNSHRTSGQYFDGGAGQPKVYAPGSRSPSPPGSHNGVLSALGEGKGKERESYSSSSGSEEDRTTSSYSVSSSTAQKGDLSLMHSHRLSHAAEVGQLARRTPAPRMSSNYSSQMSSPIMTSPSSESDSLQAIDLATEPAKPKQRPAQARHSMSTFQFNQNAELVRELYQPQLASSPSPTPPTDSSSEGQETETSEESDKSSPPNSRPTSVQAGKKLMKKRQGGGN